MTRNNSAHTQALNFLLQQTSTTNTPSSTLNNTLRQSAASKGTDIDEQGQFLKSQMSIQTLRNPSDTTPKARSQSAMSFRSPSSPIDKRRDTVAYTYESMRRISGVPETRWGGHRYKGTYRGAPIADADDFDVVAHAEADDPDASFEGLENVRGESTLHAKGKPLNPKHVAMGLIPSATILMQGTTTSTARLSDLPPQPRGRRPHLSENGDTGVGPSYRGKDRKTPIRSKAKALGSLALDRGA